MQNKLLTGMVNTHKKPLFVNLFFGTQSLKLTPFFYNVIFVFVDKYNFENDPLQKNKIIYSIFFFISIVPKHYKILE